MSKNCTLIDYEILVQGLPSGTIVLDENFESREKFVTSNFYIAIPNKEFTSDYSASIEVKNANVKTYPVILGASYNANLQSYALVANTATLETTSLEDEFVQRKSSIKIIKKDSKTKKPISNVKFKAKYENGIEIGTFITNQDGIINIEKLNQGNIIIQEIETDEKYILDDNQRTIELQYNEQKEIIIENTRKTGNLKIIKVDKDDSTKTLEGVEFDLIYPNGEIIKLVTDKNGEINLEGLNTENCVLKETKTNNKYNLTGEMEIKIEWNKTTEITVENEKKKGQIEIVKLDAENKEIKLEGVTFEILDENKNFIEKIVTNKDGYAKSSFIPIGKVYVREIEAKQGYVLKNDLIELDVKENETIKKEIENVKEKKPEPPQKPIIEKPIIKEPIIDKTEPIKLPKTGM